MTPRLLLDTHVLIRWLTGNKRLSHEQNATLKRAVKREEPIALSAMTLIEIALLASQRKLVFRDGLKEFFDDLQGNPVFRLLPLSYEVALEVALLEMLRDPADRAIVATARVHRLSLVTSDERIIGSNSVPVIT